MILCLALCLTARADVFYQYTGNPFNSVAGEVTHDDFISVILRLPDSLPVALARTPLLPISWSVFDGHSTITNQDADLLIFEIGTDATGLVNDWRVEAGSLAVNRDMGTSGKIISSVVEYNLIGSDFTSSVFPFATLGQTLGNPGFWVDPPVPTPEPATVLLLLPITILLFVRKRQFS